MATEAGLEAEPAQSAVAAMPAGSGREAELAALREFVRPEWVESCSLQMVRLNICRTRVLRLVLTATMLDGYWESSDVAVQLSSPTLPPALLAKLELACDKEARAHAGKPQLVAVAKLVLAYLETNRLVCAWDELVQARALVCTPPESDGADLEAFTASNWLRLAEKAGKVHVRAQQGAYFMEFSLLVPDTYPDAPPVLTLIATNFDDKLRDICLANAADVIRRMHEGTRCR
ncbi:hypothetical protein T492DRAFT_365038 [Pavlovales sp. CCMP2436]|nr:hypothetical protein T492DRAFT_365038 [Pavlovales sp. CCMP2436]